MSKAKTKIKMVTAKVEERVEYIAHSKCPYCKSDSENGIEDEEDFSDGPLDF